MLGRYTTGPVVAMAEHSRGAPACRLAPTPQTGNQRNLRSSHEQLALTTETGDPEFDDVSVTQIGMIRSAQRHARRGPGADDVPGIEDHELAEIPDDLPDSEDHVARRAGLAPDPVHIEPEIQSAWVDHFVAGDEPRAGGVE